MADIKVTKLSELKKIKSTCIVELGKFDDGTMLTVEMKKLNVINLIKNKMLPNGLLTIATSLIDNPVALQQEISGGNADAVIEALEMTEVVLENTFLNPTYSSIKELGIELTSEQLNNALIVAMSGPKALENFRKNFGYNEDNSSSEEV